jgi:hypothetical protein
MVSVVAAYGYLTLLLLGPCMVRQNMVGGCDKAKWLTSWQTEGRKRSRPRDKIYLSRHTPNDLVPLDPTS